MPFRSRWGALPFLAATALVSVVGSVATKRGKGLWYRSLRKSPLNPPGWAFGPVWTALYGLMSWSAYRIWRQPESEARTRALRIWGAQLALNGAWSPLFFGRHAPGRAMADLVGLVAAIVAYMREAAKIDRNAAALMAPYLGWVGFAGYLNGSIIFRNRRWA